MIPELATLSTSEREIVSFDAERLRNDPAFKLGMKVLDQRAIDALIATDPTNIEGMREAQSYVRAVRELAFVLAVLARTGSFMPGEPGSEYTDNQPVGTA
jgi:hypothetical protein